MKTNLNFSQNDQKVNMDPSINLDDTYQILQELDGIISRNDLSSDMNDIIKNERTIKRTYERKAQNAQEYIQSLIKTSSN